MLAVIYNHDHITKLLLNKSRIFRTNTYKYGINDEFIFGNYLSNWKEMNEISQQDCKKRNNEMKALYSRIKDLIIT